MKKKVCWSTFGTQKLVAHLEFCCFGLKFQMSPLKDPAQPLLSVTLMVGHNAAVYFFPQVVFQNIFERGFNLVVSPFSKFYGTAGIFSTIFTSLKCFGNLSDSREFDQQRGSEYLAVLSVRLEI